MTNLLARLVAVLIIIAIVYSIGVFVTQDLNPATWSPFCRLLASGAAVWGWIGTADRAE